MPPVLLSLSKGRLGEPPRAAPAVAGPPGEVLEAACRFLRLLALLLRRRQFTLDIRDQPAVLGQTQPPERIPRVRWLAPGPKRTP